MTTNIRSTKDYSLFELHEFNRNIRNMEYLEKSMRKYGWIDAYPMHVVRNGSKKLKIKGGHHRFEVAKKLDIPVKFVVCEDNGISIHELEKATTSWSLSNYLESYVRMGLPNYIAVNEYVNDTGIPLLFATSILAGESAGSSNKTGAFKDGNFTLGNQDHANKIKSIVLYMKSQGIAFAAHSYFIQALSKVLWLKCFDVSKFKKKIGVHAHKAEKKPDVDSYLEEIEKIYNYSSQDRQPIAFLARENSKTRKLTFGRKN